MFASGVLLAYRLVAAALLIYVGTYFLATLSHASALFGRGLWHVEVGNLPKVYTVNVTELILNAALHLAFCIACIADTAVCLCALVNRKVLEVALEIILDIDDLIFDALATTPGRHLVWHLVLLVRLLLPSQKEQQMEGFTAERVRFES